MFGVLRAESDVVIGAAAGLLAGPFLVSYAKQLVGGIGGTYAGALANVGVGAVALLLVGKARPGMAAAFATVCAVRAIQEVVPALRAA